MDKKIFPATHSHMENRIETAVAKNLRLTRRDALKYLLGGAAAVAFGSIGGPSMGFLKEAYAARANIPGDTATTYTIQQIGGIITAIPSRSVERGIGQSGMSSPNSVITGTHAGSIIQQACNGNNRKVFVRAGNYMILDTLDWQSLINVQNVNNVELYGEPGTILKLAANQPGGNGNVIQFTNSSYINIHDLEVDGNRFNQAGGAGGGTVGQGNNMVGIVDYQCTNVTVQNCNVHDCRCFGIEGGGTGSQYLNNTVTNSDANGMNIGNSTGGSVTVSGNTVDGASDVGIAIWGGAGCIVKNNTIRNITMTRSPFGWQSGEFLTNEHAGLGNQFLNNVGYNCRGPAFYQSGGNGLVNSNQFTLCRAALQLDNNAGTVTFTNNTIDQIGKVSGQVAFGAAVDILSGCGSGCSITGNTFTNAGPYLSESAVIELTGGGGTFSNSTVSTGNGKYNPISAGSGWTLLNNKIVA